MGYLICQNCKGYYKLRDGEKPEDFTTTCACGGNLRYAINMDVVSTETPPINNPSNEKKEYQKSENEDKYNKLIACPDCGHQLSKKAKKCPNCGRVLSYIDKHGHKPKTTIKQLIAFMGGVIFFTILGIGLAFYFNFDGFLYGGIGVFILGLAFCLWAYNDDKKYYKELEKG